MEKMNESGENLKVGATSKDQWNPIEQLELKVNKSDTEDYQQIVKLLTSVLTYPSNQFAELHMEADRLGTKDLLNQLKQRNDTTKELDDEHTQLQFCPCCGFVRQTETLKICTHLNSINNIGISTYLYFQTIKNLVILLVVMSLIYSVFALATNIIASNVYKQASSALGIFSTSMEVGYVALSLGSKQLNKTDVNANYYYIQCWLGMGMAIVWTLMFFILKYFEKEQETRVEDETTSASDYTIAIENVPKDLTKQELQIQLDEYEQSLHGYAVYYKKPLKIAKINVGVPFFLNKDDFKDQELEKLKKRSEELKQIFVNWVKERQQLSTFSTSKEERQKLYQEHYENLAAQMKKFSEIGQKIEQAIKEGSTSGTATTTAFVTFESSHAVKLMTSLNDPTLASRFRYILSCCQGENKFSFKRNQTYYPIKIQRAPEPEDVIWANLGVPDCQIYKRKFITFTATVVMLGISFAIVFGLSKAQQQANNSTLSLAISIVISVMNIAIGIVIRKLTFYEKDYTQTKHQTSLAIKSVMASLINSILIPMIINYKIKYDANDGVYGEHGLASDVFMLGLTNSFVPPVLKLINPDFIINRLLKWKASWSSSRLSSSQRALNDAHEFLIFEAGYEYVYLVSLFLFTCFFVSLQPIISFFAIFGMGLMYWGQKYSLFNRMKRPVPGTDLINVTMFQLIISGAAIYSLGSLTWSNFTPGGIPQSALLPNLIALAISTFMIVLPYNVILTSCIDQNEQINSEFLKNRILLPSEYDRLNPDTSKQALTEFQQFYKKQIESIKNKSKQEQQKLMEKFAKQGARGQQRHRSQKNPMQALFQPTSALISSIPQAMIDPSSAQHQPPAFNFASQMLGSQFNQGPPQLNPTQSVMYNQPPPQQAPNFYGQQPPPTMIYPVLPQNTYMAPPPPQMQPFNPYGASMQNSFNPGVNQFGFIPPRAQGYGFMPMQQMGFQQPQFGMPPGFW